MKKNFTLKFSLRSIFTVLLFIPLTYAFGQPALPEYYFQKPVLETGTDLQEGAIYRFSNVKPGVDALVEVIKFTGGITLSSIDETWTGFDEAFQPFIDCTPGSDGFVEFEIRFVVGGTNSSMNQLEVPITPIDIDGGKSNNLFEQDAILIENGYVDYDLLGTKLVTGNIGGGWFAAKDITGVALSGIDTTDRQAMFTVVNGNVNKIHLKVGAQNNSTTDSEIRYRSVYFKKFTYSNKFLLSASPLQSFTGHSNDTHISLQWNLADNNQLKTVVLERAHSQGQFAAVYEATVAGVNQFQFNDETSSPVNYYRLKLIGATGKVEYSNILVFKAANSNKPVFKVYPSVIANNTIISINAEKTENATFQLLDLSGRIVYQQSIRLQSGNNVTVVNTLSSINPGNYIAMVKTGNKIYSQQVIRQ